MQRRLVWIAGGVVLLGSFAWLANDVRKVGSDLLDVRDAAHQVKADATAGRPLELTELRRRAQHARSTTNDPVWHLGEHLPFVGGNLRAVRRVADAADVLARTTLPAADRAITLAHGGTVVKDGRVDLGVLARLHTEVRTALRGSEDADTTLAGRDHTFDFLQKPLREARSDVRDLRTALQSADSALAIAPGLLGSSTPRHYLVAVQNNAESRATGGLVGVAVLVKADRGVLSLEDVRSDNQLLPSRAPVPSSPQAARTWVAEGSTIAWFDANLTPHFPDAASNLAGLWHAQSGQQVDGVVALDPLVMRQLLRRPVTLQHVTVNSSNIVDFVAHGEYTLFPSRDVRRAVLRDLARELFRQFTHDAEVKALQNAAGSGHLFVWSRHAEEQALLSAHLLGGALPRDDTPYLQVLTQNVAGNKLDYYLQRTVRARATAEGLAVTVTVANRAPLGLPAYMVSRPDQRPVPYGESRLAVSVYGALSSQLAAVKVDGRPEPMAFDRDNGHDLGTLTVELPRNTPVTITFVLSEPTGTLVYRQQPLVRPDVLDLGVPHTVLGS